MKKEGYSNWAFSKLKGALVTLQEYKVIRSVTNNKMTFALMVHHFTYIGNEGSPPVSSTTDANKSPEVLELLLSIRRFETNI
jgi:hypothetical protein